MKKISNEKGFSVVEIVLVLVVFILIGVIGWLVYKDHHNNSKPSAVVTAEHKSTSSSSTNSNKTNTSKTNASTLDTANYNSWNAVPADMQTELLAEWRTLAPNGCQAGDTYQAEAKTTINSQEPLVTYNDQFMMHGLGCDGGAVYLFAKQNGSWQSLGSSQGSWDCSLIKNNNVPTALLQADNIVENAGQGNGLPVKCVDSSGTTQTLAS